jgi:VWFA-related protein
MRKILVWICAVGMVWAQDPAKPQEPVKTEQSDKPLSITTRVVLAPVTVVDRSGSFVPGLTPYDFRLYDNGKIQRITEDMATHPLSVVVVIQANSEVEKILPSIQRLAPVFESMVIGEDGEMAVVGFDHRVQVLTDFTTDTAKIDDAFHRLHVGSWSAALNDATMRAINMLKARPTNRRRVVIQIAENLDKGSEIKHIREVLTEAEFANVVFYSVDISQLISKLTSQALPNRQANLPPGAEHLPMGQSNTLTTQSQMEMGNWEPALVDIFNALKGVFVADPLDIYTKYTGGR